MDKYQNKYRSASARASWWNYASDGLYFITICTDNREHYFGEIVNGEISLSEMGLIIQQEWNKSFEIRTELFCDVYVIMPNHIHAILRIENNNSTGGIADTHGNIVGSHGNIVGSHGRANLQQPPKPIQGQTEPPQSHGVAYRAPKSISSFVAGFKSAATKRINEFRKMPKSPVWQTRFHDHIIQDKNEYIRIKKYILENPQNWDQDNYLKNG